MTAALTLLCWKLGSVSRRSSWLGWLHPVGKLVYLIGRWLEGANRVETTTLPRRMSGTYAQHIVLPASEDTVEFVRVDFAPSGRPGRITGEGHVYGYPAFYRSSGDDWSLRIAATYWGDPMGDDAFVHYERPYFRPEAGFVVAEVSEACIQRAVYAFQCGRLDVVGQFWRDRAAAAYASDLDLDPEYVAAFRSTDEGDES